MSLEDKLYNLLEIYDRSPKLISEIIAKLYLLIPETTRLGKRYDEFRYIIARTEFWNKMQLLNFQNSELLKTIECAKRTKFYPRYYKDFGIDINSVKSIADIERLPFITKDILKKYLSDLINMENKKNGLYLTSGGSTGTPVGFYLEKGISRSKELAFMENQWGRVGYKHNDKCAVIRGGVVSSDARGATTKIDYFRNWLILSSYHMTDSNLPQYIEALNNYAPKFIQGYPSALFIISKYMNKNSINLSFMPKAILAGSENIYIYQQKEIEKAFMSKIYSWYGHSERVVLGGYCEEEKKYHLFPQYGYSEVINDSGVVISNGRGELVGTSFHNNVMPLIRYRTGDIVILSKKQKCKCCRNYLLLDYVEGREHDLIVSSTGRKISMTAINMHSSIFDNIKQFQFYQNKKGEIQFRYVEISPINQKEERNIRKGLEYKLGNDFELTLERVDDIELNPNGKHRVLIQEISEM